MSLTSQRTLPSLGAIALLALGLSGCATGDDTMAPRAQITLRVADAALASGAPDLALRVADLVLTKQPDNAAALTARGDALYAMGQNDLANQAYAAATKLDPKSAAAQLGLGRTVIRTDPQAAEAAFLRATVLQPDNVVALSNLGVARDLQKHHAAAQEAYRAALTLAPEMADARVNLGLSLALSGQAEAAVQILRPLASEPGATQIWHADLAVALAQAGDVAGAQHALHTPDMATPPAIASAARAAADAPVAVPAPVVAVVRQDMPAPHVARVDAPPAAEPARLAVAPAAPADIAPNPVFAALVTAVPAAAPAASPTSQTSAAIDLAGPATLPTPAGAPHVAAGSPDAPQTPSTDAPAASTRPPAAPASPAHVAAPEPVAAAQDASPPSRPVPSRAVPVLVAAFEPVAHTATASAPLAAVHPTAASVPVPIVHAAAASEPGSPAHAAVVPESAVTTNAEPPAATHTGRTAWLQLAAVRSEQDVQFEWRRLQARWPELLDGRSLTVSQEDAHDHSYWRLRTGGFASLVDATTLCQKIRLVGGRCFALISGGT